MKTIVHGIGDQDTSPARSLRMHLYIFIVGRPFGVSKENEPSYRLMVVRRLFFFLDPNRRGKISIQVQMRVVEASSEMLLAVIVLLQ